MTMKGMKGRNGHYFILIIFVIFTWQILPIVTQDFGTENENNEKVIDEVQTADSAENLLEIDLTRKDLPISKQVEFDPIEGGADAKVETADLMESIDMEDSQSDDVEQDEPLENAEPNESLLRDDWTFMKEILSHFKSADVTNEDEIKKLNFVYDSSKGPDDHDGNSEVYDGESRINISDANKTSSDSIYSRRAICLQLNRTEKIGNVEVISANDLATLLTPNINITSRSTPALCKLVYFYSPFCPFSILGSPVVNALARLLPNIQIYGLDSIEHHSVNARFGVLGTPTLILFHNGHGVARYNSSDYSPFQLATFVSHFTDQTVPVMYNVTEEDYHAYLPAKIVEAQPVVLYLAWSFLVSCGMWLFLSSDLCARLKEAILNNWQEAEAQHHHED